MSALSVVIAMMLATAFVVWMYAAAPRLMLWWKFVRVLGYICRVGNQETRASLEAQKQACKAQNHVAHSLRQLGIETLDAMTEDMKRVYVSALDLHDRVKAQNEQAHAETEAAWSKNKQAQKLLWKGKLQGAEDMLDAYEERAKIWMRQRQAWQGVEQAWRRVAGDMNLPAAGEGKR
ncbi:MAG: hypothetical protein MJE68_28020 [Proteobacteria bacterium]|nr:hypothetical protein [Pseudomonadota bacterium]